MQSEIEITEVELLNGALCNASTFLSTGTYTNFLPALLQYIFALMRILMVCLGNICRSPLAQGILQHKALQAGLNWHVESAGTEAYHEGEPPHKLSQKVAKLNGIDICRQKARRFIREDLVIYDKIYVMDEDNYIDVKRISRDLWDESKVDYLLNATFPGRNISVPDPWFGGEDGYHKVYKMVSLACDQIIEEYLKVKSEK